MVAADFNCNEIWLFIGYYDLSQCGPTFCDTWANLYNAANVAGHKQNTK
jgi:hypothetical protein